jgi:hypothetical protein
MDVVGNIGLSDVQKAWEGAKRIDANPLRLAGRLAGLGSSELEAGVPTWAWVAVAFGTGALLTALYGDKVTDKIKAVF